MINQLLYWLRRPEKGFDPISADYAKEYFYRNNESPALIEAIVSEVDQFCEGLSGKTLLDLGAGPGHFSHAFAKKGAKVTWQDISKNFSTLFDQHYGQDDVNIRKQIGYFEDASGLYDVIFNRVCFYYSINDKKLLTHILSLLKPSGCAYIILNNEKQYPKKQSFFRYATALMNNYLGIKIGHPMMNNRRIRKLFSGFSFSYFSFKICGAETVVRFRK